MAALGRVINTNNMMRHGGYGGPFSPMAMNPFMSMFGGMYGNQQANGIVSNIAVVSTGTTIYSGMIRQVSWVEGRDGSAQFRSLSNWVVGRAVLAWPEMSIL